MTSRRLGLPGGIALLLGVATLAVLAALGLVRTSSGSWAGGASSVGSPSAGLRAVPGTASTISILGVATQPAALSAADSLGPPSWVKPGTRLTFYSAAASVAQSRFAWVEDPDGPWEDPATGQHYRRTDDTGEGVGTSSGDGVGQVDVLAVDGTKVALSMTLYGIDHEHGVFVPGSTTGAEVPGAEIDGLWVNPARLAQLPETRTDGVLILRGPYQLGGRTYQAMSFAVTTPGAYAQYTYDTASGVLLSSTSSTAGAASPVTAPGESPPQGNTELTVTYFAGLRQRTVPGLGGTNPSWVARTQRLDYTGTYSWTNPVDPTSGTYTAPMSIAISLKPGGRSWASYAAQTSIQGLGTSSGQGITGPTGLYWLSPTALAALASAHVGQVLDQDPITGEQLVVQGVGQQLTIDSRLPGITTRAGYDPSTGVLTSYAAQVPGSGTTIQLRLVSTDTS